MVLLQKLRAHKLWAVMMALVLLVSLSAGICGVVLLTGGFSTPRPSYAETIQTDFLSQQLSVLRADYSGKSFPANMQPQFTAAYAYNNDTAGHIKIAGTSIDTLLVQGADNDYYLLNDFYDVYTQYGNAFIDRRNNLADLDANTILYGHNNNTATQVFSDMHHYEDPAFYKKYPLLEFTTLYLPTQQYKIFAVFYTNTQPEDDNGYMFYYIPTRIPQEKYAGFMQQVQQRMLYSTGVECAYGEKMLTLSTCSYVYGKSIDTRLVIMARPLREGESPTVDADAVQRNTNYRRPQAWYTKQGQPNPYKNSARWTP